MSPTWAVVATVDEPAPLVAAFASHHLAQGAKAVYLFLDRPCEETQDLLSPLRDCHVTVCTDAFWQENTGWRPQLHTRRQKINATRVYRETPAEWLLHCDADEFVRDGTAMAEEMADFGKDVKHLRLFVAERVHLREVPSTSIFDGIFRLPFRTEFETLDAIYHPVTGFLERGVTGHTAGKGLVRCGLKLKMAIHQPEGNIPSQRLQSTRLLHFDGLTQFHFLIKLLRRVFEVQVSDNPRHAKGRLTQLEAMRDNLDDAAFCFEIVAALKCLTAEQFEQLQRQKKLDERPFTPDMGGLSADLSVKAFDQALRLRFRDFLLENAPVFARP